MYVVVKRLAVAAAIVLLPSIALAQASLTGTVRTRPAPCCPA